MKIIHSKRCVFYAYLPIVREECPDCEFENFYHQIIAANLVWNATEIVRFLKYVQKLGFFAKKPDLFQERKQI